MKILLTGGSGFIGRHLLTSLSKAHLVDAPSSRQLDLLNFAAVCEYLEHRRYDLVIHAAGYGRESVAETNPEVAQKITNMFYSLHANRLKFDKFINLGSGAEFGLSAPCVEKKEMEILDSWPMESYGLAKNIVARTILDYQNFHNVRIFGCFDPSENNRRLFSNFKNHCQKGTPFYIENRQFDYISLEDLVMIITHVAEYKIRQKDINAVYFDKMTLEQLLIKFCEVNHLDTNIIKIASESHLHYTGNGRKLYQYQLPFGGLEKTMKAYYE